MDVRDRGHEAHRIDPRGVRESGGAAEERKPDRRRAVQSKQIERLVEEARNVAGVRRVENLLHVPGVPAPTGGRA